MGERVLSGIILSCAREKGDVRIEEGRGGHQYASRPYISGHCCAPWPIVNFNFIPSVDEMEDMDFKERIANSFNVGLKTDRHPRIDVVVLVKMGESFANGARKTKITKNLLHPKVLFRLIRDMHALKIEGRQMLPKDLWTLKALLCGGADTALYKEKIAHYWGALPFDMYGCTEEGAIATQAWNKKYLTFFPDAAFYEFIPEEEWFKWRSNHAYVPKTVLFDQVRPGKKYELVITNFDGKPLLRYRTYDLIEFPAMQDTEAGINLPQMSFCGRASDFIDLAGFTGLIDEKMVWKAIHNTGIEYKEGDRKNQRWQSDLAPVHGTNRSHRQG
jgi:hypothetical protein